MKRYISSLPLFIIVLTFGIVFGIAIDKYQIFPYKYIKSLHGYLIRALPKAKIYGPWSIGIYEGTTLLNLADPKEISNPVLTGKDVDDIDATFVADPFMLSSHGKWFMFFEVFNRNTSQGDIGYAKSENGKKWHYQKIIIDEKFHLSYPYVFEWDNNYYLVPESQQDFSVRLYKAISFPDKWQYIGNLLSGHKYADPSLFRYANKWWMFASTGNNNVLNLYFSEDLFTGWLPHPMNPIIKFNGHIARPGGKVVIYNDKLYRLTQDCKPIYGNQVFGFQISKLSTTEYEEKLLSNLPLITKTNNLWNALGMHTLDPHKLENKWIAAVDGRNK